MANGAKKTHTWEEPKTQHGQTSLSGGANPLQAELDRVNEELVKENTHCSRLQHEMQYG